jgi:hypothetical protein
MTDSVKFNKLIGHEVIIFSRVLESSLKPIPATIRGAEAGGIWIESQHTTDLVLEVLREKMLAATPIFFLPFSAISYVMVLRGGVPSMSSDIAE